MVGVLVVRRVAAASLAARLTCEATNSRFGMGCLSTVSVSQMPEAVGRLTGAVSPRFGEARAVRTARVRRG